MSTERSFAVHSVSADPSGGTYNSTQSVTLTATQNSTIYYTIDGSVPNNSSSIYLSPIEISSNTTLEFFAAATADNHSSSVVIESYTIDTDFPVVAQTYPENGQTGVPTSAIINATFSEPMDETTINSSTFIVEDRDHFVYTGNVSYDSARNTATFVPDFLTDSVFYTVTLKQDIKDLSGNGLQSDYSWNFVTGPHLVIVLTEIRPFESALLGGGTFTITPDPFTLTDSFTIKDNEPLDQDPTDGLISIRNIELGTFAISETGVPTGYGNIYDNVIVTAHETSLSLNLVAVFNNRNLTIPITDFQTPEGIGVPPPDLTSDQFDLYKDSVVVGRYPGIQANGAENAVPITSVGPNSIEGARIETLTTFESPEVAPRAMLFSISGTPGSTAQELFTGFKIPTYPDIDGTIAADVFYFVPAFVIPYGDSGNNYLLTPVIGNLSPGLTLVLEQPAFIVSQEAKVERVNMTFSSQGNNVGFSFAITDKRPPGTPEPPLDVNALFLDIDFVGDVDYSKPEAFESSPVIDILVNKTLSGFNQLPDGCVDFQLLLFNEGTGDWEITSQLRNPTRDTDTQCGFTLQPEHFSKFAVGGVKGQTVVTEEHITHGGGGGPSRSTVITQTPTGSDVNTAITTQSGSVLVHFETVNEGSGQLKINANELSVFEQYFDEIAFMSQDNRDHGMVHIDGKTYSTAGDVFDIDASSVKFEGAVEVTIPYNEETVKQFGPESNIRFIHYDHELNAWEDRTASVDETANTVTGALDSLSPVSAAIILEGVGITADNPILRAKLATPSLSISDGGQVILSTRLDNTQSINQDYALLVQVVDENNVAQHIDWQKGTLGGNQHSEISISWNEMQHGKYRVQVLLLTDLENPWFLAEPVTEQLNI